MPICARPYSMYGALARQREIHRLQRFLLVVEEEARAGSKSLAGRPDDADQQSCMGFSGHWLWIA